MAYTPATLRRDQSVCSRQWIYDNTDTSGTVFADGYFTNGRERGLRIGDGFTYVRLDVDGYATAVYLSHVVGMDGAVPELADPVQIYPTTESTDVVSAAGASRLMPTAGGFVAGAPVSSNIDANDYSHFPRGVQFGRRCHIIYYRGLNHGQSDLDSICSSQKTSGAGYLLLDSEDAVTGTLHTITAIDTGSNTITVSGDRVSTYNEAGLTIEVKNQGNSDGFYTVVSATLNTGNTDIVVVQTIPDNTVAGYVGLRTGGGPSLAAVQISLNLTGNEPGTTVFTFYGTNSSDANDSTTLTGVDGSGNINGVTQFTSKTFKTIRKVHVSAATNGYIKIGQREQASNIVHRYSDDGGKTWSAACNLVNGLVSTGGDGTTRGYQAGIAVTLTGKIVAFYFTGTIGTPASYTTQRRTNNVAGEASGWSDPETVTFSGTLGIRPVFYGAIRTLADGSFVTIGANDRYVWCLKSTDEGLNWTAIGTIRIAHPAGSAAITAVNQGAKTLTLGGVNETANILAGDVIFNNGGGALDSGYTVASCVLDGSDTVITTVETPEASVAVGRIRRATAGEFGFAMVNELDWIIIGRVNYAGLNGMFVWKTHDAGVTWALVGETSAPEGGYVSAWCEIVRLNGRQILYWFYMNRYRFSTNPPGDTNYTPAVFGLRTADALLLLRQSKIFGPETVIKTTSTSAPRSGYPAVFLDQYGGSYLLVGGSESAINSATLFCISGQPDLSAYFGGEELIEAKNYTADTTNYQWKRLGGYTGLRLKGQIKHNNVSSSWFGLRTSADHGESYADQAGNYIEFGSNRTSDTACAITSRLNADLIATDTYVDLDVKISYFNNPNKKTHFLSLAGVAGTYSTAGPFSGYRDNAEANNGLTIRPGNTSISGAALELYGTKAPITW